MGAPLEERLHEFTHSLAGQDVRNHLNLEHTPESVTATARSEAYRGVIDSFLSIFPEYRSAFQGYSDLERHNLRFGI